MNRMIHAVKFVSGIPLAAFSNELGGTFEYPAIHFFELVIGQRVARWIEIAKITESEAEGVKDLSIGLAEMRHHAFAHFHIGLIFDVRNPKTKQIDAQIVRNFSWIDSVGQSFRR